MTMIVRLLILASLVIASSAQTGESGMVPDAQLLQACVSGTKDKLDDVKMALENGANIDIVDKRSGQTPLMAATLRGKKETVEYLLKQGADVTIPEKDGYTLAHGAAFQGRPSVLETLDQFGIDILTATHEDGFLPCHRACWGNKSGHAEAVEILLKAGFDPDVEAENGMRCSEMTDNEKTKAILEKFGALPPRPEKIAEQEL